MVKRIISGICVLSILLSCVINLRFFAYAQSDTVALPDRADIVWDFDNCNVVSAADTQWVTKDPALNSRVTLEYGADSVYGGQGKSLKFNYVDGMRVWRNTTTDITGEALVVWVKSDRETSLTVLGLINDWFNTGSHTLPVKKGENVLLFYFKDFKCTTPVTGSVTKINQLQFITNGTGIMWIDSVGFYTEKAGDDTDLTDFPPGTVNKWNFDGCGEISAEDSEWTTKEMSDSARLTLETGAANVYGGVGKSLKWTHTDSMRLWAGNKEIPVLGDGVTMWIKSGKDAKITLYGYINGWSTVGTLTLDIRAGENIVCFKYSDMTFIRVSDWSETDKPAKITKFIQMQLISSGSGTLWIDSIGFYTEPSPTDPEYDVPDAVLKHGLDFLETALKESAWSNSFSANADFRVLSAASKYHSGITNVGENTSAMRISYKNLSAAGNVQLVYNEKISLLKLEPDLRDEDSVLSFWVWSSQPLKLKVGVTKNKTVSVSAGENIIKIGIKDLVTEGENVDYTVLSKLTVTLAADSVFETEGLLYLDAFGFYNTGYSINTDMALLPQDTVIWWDFDQYETCDELSGEWTKHWSGTNDKGVTISMEEDSSSVYSGEGRSLKIEYDRVSGEWNQPGIWHPSLMSTYGKGFAFWIKSNEKTTFDLVCLDAKYRDVSVNDIELDIGENIILIDYDDFAFTAPIEGETPKMDKVSQWQIRMSGCNNGTVWLDSFAFYGISAGGYNTSKFLNPPDSYDNFEEGNHSAGDDFEAWKGDDDLEFCTDWYYENTGWITLEKSGGSNTVLKMDYDMSAQTSILKNITAFKKIDPNGGISFWAKSSEERNYKVTITLGGRSISSVIKGSTEGRYYKIPFSEFWSSSDISVSFEAESRSLTDATFLEISTDQTVNPPALDASKACTLWLDDICFVDSLAYKRAGAVNHYENGVRLIAGEDAFSSGVEPVFTPIIVSDSQKKNYLSQMRDADRFVSFVSLKAYDMSGIAAIPERSVELIFDLPAGVAPENAVIYQSYFDGSLLKTSTAVGHDGKLHATVYRLGDYVLAYNSAGTSAEFPGTGDESNIPVVLSVLISSIFAVTVFGSKKLDWRGGNEE